MNYKERYKKAVDKNVSQVLTQLESKDMRVKISNWANKFGYSFEEIKQKITEDEIFRCVFAKDPAKQNLYENIAVEYISSLKEVSNFEKLQSAGKKALYVENGKILSGEIYGKQAKPTKSIDFKWNTEGYTIYASHKYTKDDGGAQDNQYKDLQEFLKNALDCNEANVIFIAICDGEYYERKDSKTGDTTKIARLQRLTNNQNVFSFPITELQNFLKNL